MPRKLTGIVFAILLVSSFTPTCPFCRQQFAYWREILERADKANFQVIGLVNQAEDKTRLEKYLREMGCAQDSPAPLRVAFVPQEALDSYRLNATPITLIVANDGTVTKAWNGLWQQSQTSEAKTVFGLNLTMR
ncbi:MAG: redoxin domain-containing protein [Acidobacteria bacterium]|nr:redoxin domain-containing protein [Acidobacteriota bacterium]